MVVPEVMKYHSFPINLAWALTRIYRIRISNENATHSVALGRPLLLPVVDTLLAPIYRHSQIIWAMIDREYCRPYCSTSPGGVLYIHNLHFTEKPFFLSSNSPSHLSRNLLLPPMNSFKLPSKRFPLLLFSRLILVLSFLQLPPSLTLLIPSIVSQSL